MSHYGYSDMLKALARSANARRVLEIGGGPEGWSGWAFAEAMGEGGELWTIDIEAEHPPGWVMCRAEQEHGITWRRIIGDSLRVALDDLKPGFDVLYIDGDHGGDHAVGDFRRFAPLVRPGGLVVYDDYPIAEGVRAAVQVLGLESFHGTALTYNHEDGNSHYVFRMPLTWQTA